MAPWLIPALKAVLPHIGTIITAAKPVFTRKTDAAGSDATPLPQQQIEELQAAAAQNATHVRELAGQLKDMVDALEQAAAQADARLRRAVWMGALAGAAAGAVITVILLAYLPR
ncbi:MAG TPA: hypothetical protein VIS77_04315 [Burkholderiales bacterium]